jgi:signal peptidase I
VCCPHCCTHSSSTVDAAAAPRRPLRPETSPPPSWPWRLVKWTGGSIGALAMVAVLAATVPALFGWNSIKVLGSSMGGALPLGSIAVTREVPANEIRLGDVILFTSKAGAIPTLHRVVRLETQDGKRVAITKGDANRKEDLTPVVMETTGSVVQYHVPLLGYLFAALANNAKLLLFLIAPLGLIGVMLTPARDDTDDTDDLGDMDNRDRNARTRDVTSRPLVSAEA